MRFWQWWEAATAGEDVVGGSPVKRGWRPAFVIALAAVAASLVLLAIVVGGALIDDGGPQRTTFPALANDGGTRTPTVAAVLGTTPPAATAPATAGAATTAAPTATPANGEIRVVGCGDILAPLDKQHRLPSDCAPGDLVSVPAEFSYGGEQLMRAAASAAFTRLARASAADGRKIYARSTYRSYQTQVATFEQSLQRFGREYTLRSVASPGHSEHQLGTTVDVTSASAGFELEGFEDTLEAKWVAENAWRFGFVISYPAGREAVTGYLYEPWHLRFVGEDVAQRVRESGLTLREYLGRR